jgi:hypothetical protein
MLGERAHHERKGGHKLRGVFRPTDKRTKGYIVDVGADGHEFSEEECDRLRAEGVMILVVDSRCDDPIRRTMGNGKPSMEYGRFLVARRAGGVLEQGGKKYRVGLGISPELLGEKRRGPTPQELATFLQAMSTELLGLGYSYRQAGELLGGRGKGDVYYHSHGRRHPKKWKIWRNRDVSEQLACFDRRRREIETALV